MPNLPASFLGGFQRAGDLFADQLAKLAAKLLAHLRLDLGPKLSPQAVPQSIAGHLPEPLGLGAGQKSTYPSYPARSADRGESQRWPGHAARVRPGPGGPSESRATRDPNTPCHLVARKTNRDYAYYIDLRLLAVVSPTFERSSRSDVRSRRVASRHQDRRIRTNQGRRLCARALRKSNTGKNQSADTIFSRGLGRVTGKIVELVIEGPPSSRALTCAIYALGSRWRARTSATASRSTHCSSARSGAFSIWE